MISSLNQTDKIQIKSDLAKGASMQTLVGDAQGWKDHVMRVVEVEPGGYTPKHSHPWPHINYIIDGNGSLFLDGVANPVGQYSYAFVPAGELHQFKNEGDSVFRFICIVPKEGHL